MARAILIAAEKGLRLPIVYNTNAYDSVAVLKLLDGIVDVYLPDLKYAEDEAGYLYSKVRSYRECSRAAIAEMYRQTGDELIYDQDGLLQRGLVIRLLVLPNDIGGVRESLGWIHDELSPRVAVSLMAQYYPTNTAGTNQTRPARINVTCCCRDAFGKRNGCARSPRWTSLAWKKDGCRNTMARRFIIALTLTIARRRSGISGTLTLIQGASGKTIHEITRSGTSFFRAV